MKKITIYFLLFIVASIGIYKLLYEYNIIKYDNVLVQGQLVNINGNKQSNILINAKFHVDKNMVLDKKTVFKFYKNNEKLLEVEIEKNLYDSTYHYHLKKEYLNNPRDVDSFMNYFCEFNTCALTLAFLKNEIKKEIMTTNKITLDDKEIEFKKIIYDYNKSKNSIEEPHNIIYQYNKNNIQICTKFDNIKYTETLRITTVDYNNEAIQKVCTKEDTEGSCCSLEVPVEKYKNISILHWKGSWNEGYFKEYNINLKEDGKNVAK